MLYNCNKHKTKYATRKEMFLVNSIQHSNNVFNCFKQLKLGLFLSAVYLPYLMSIIISVFLSGYYGKMIDFAKASSSHRTPIAHFLNNCKWNSDKFQDIVKESVVSVIYQDSSFFNSSNPLP